MRRSVKNSLAGTAAALAVLTVGYWYFAVFPLQKARNTALDQVFFDRQLFAQIEGDRMDRAFRAIDEGRDPPRFPARVDCDSPKYGETSRLLGTAIAYNQQVKKVRSAERALKEFKASRQEKRAERARAESVSRFEVAEVLKKEIECYELAHERTSPSY